MARETTLNGSTRKETSPAAGVRENIAELTHDIISLSELQGQLFLVDLNDGTKSLRLPLALGLAGTVLALGSVPVLLVGISYALTAASGLHIAASLSIVAAVTIAVACLLLWLAWRYGNAAIKVFTRSKHEFSENLRWIKRALVNGKRHLRN